MGPGSGRTIFISYAHEDASWKEQFESMLAPARDRGLIDIWTDGEITPGENWAQSITRALDSARAGLLLVTDAFLNSTFIKKIELAALLKAAGERGVSIWWVPVSASLHKYSELEGIQSAWDPERPLASLESAAKRKEAIQQICIDIVEHLGQLQSVTMDRRGSFRAKIESKLQGRYAISDEFATGKFAIVYRAERKNPRRMVVVKALAVSEIDSWVRRVFVKRADRAVNLSSSAFIKIYEYFMDESPECLITEYVEGKRLSESLWNYPEGLPLSKVKSILIELATAMSEAHKAGWLRGELCMSDILVDSSWMPRISPLDFSNVLRDESQGAANFLVDRESLSYMTPERFKGAAPTLAADQYSLGLIATELLGGLHLPRVVNPCDLLDKPKLFADLEAGNGAWSRRSPEFAGIVSRMLRQEPGERWPSLDDVRHLLEDIEADPLDRKRKIAMSNYLRLQGNFSALREFFSSFYQNLNEMAPHLKTHFQSMDMERQYKVLNLAIHSLIEFRSESITARAQLHDLAEYHAKYGLRGSDYALFLDAFIKTVERLSGNRDDHTPAAWRAALQPAIDYLSQCAEEGAAGPAGPGSEKSSGMASGL